MNLEILDMMFTLIGLLILCFSLEIVLPAVWIYMHRKF